MAMALNGQGLKPIEISQESGMEILANFSDNLTNQTVLEINSTQNQTMQNNSSLKRAGENLWSWGKIPIGYEVGKDGSLVKMADQEWSPSI